MDQRSVFISGYNENNLQVAKENGILGWKMPSKLMKQGDYVFIYNITLKKIDCLFEANYEVNKHKPLWDNELKSKSVIYKIRWSADLIFDNLNIGLNEISRIRSYDKELTKFTFNTIHSPYPTFLNERFPEFAQFLLKKISDTNPKNKIQQEALSSDNKTQYFLIQVGDPGSKNILQNSCYENLDWKDNKKDSDHGKVKVGDVLVVYFTGNSIKFKYTLKKIYRVDSITANNEKFNLSELLTLKGIPYSEIIKLKDNPTKKYLSILGTEGRNILLIEKKDYDSLIEIDNELNQNSSKWIERLLKSFNELGETSKYYHIHEIYTKIKEIILREDEQLPSSYESTVRYYLESNSRGKNNDLFVPKSSRIDYWRLKTKEDSYNKNDTAKEEFSDIKNPSLWLIRAGGKGEGAQIALDNKLVGIGYGGLPELHKIKDFKTFRETYARTHLEDTKYRVVAVVPQIWKFMNKVKIGDFVILPLPPQTKLMAVGKIMDEYKIGDLHSEIQQYRPVYWLKKDVSIEEFDPEIKRWLGARGTVHYVGGIEIVNKLTDMLKRLGVNDAELEKINHMDNTPTPDEDNKNDYNLENKWLSLKDVDIKEIIQNVLTAKNKKLEIDENVVERIISHLSVAKHVILVGPPGTGKTDLARRVLRELGNRIINNPEPIETVASYEWGRYEVIGGRSIISNEGGSSFHFGCVTNAINQKKFLLIDEFNRADMNKAFGEMFLALDHGEIQLREDEYIDDIGNNTKIQIPENFRMICTMNDYDKSLLNELSYGLLRRFAFVEINVPDDKQKVKNIVLERTYQKLKHLDPKFDSEKVQPYIDKFIDFLFSIKSKREIGLASYIDVISYLMHSIIVMKNDPGSALNDALVDYILPQFDRLDIETIRLAYDTALRIFNFQDGNGRTIESINPFLFNLKNRIQRLEDLNKLFKFGEDGL